MERPSLQDNPTAPGRPPALADLPAPNRGTGKGGFARRPIALRSERPIIPTEAGEQGIEVPASTGRRRKSAKAAPRATGRRPIGLKSDLVIADSAASRAGGPQGTKAARNRRAGEAAAKRRLAKSTAAPAVAKQGDVSGAVKTRSVKAPQARKPAQAKARAKAPARGRARQEAPAAREAPAPRQQVSPGTEFVQVLGAWARQRWRLLLVIGLSFIAGSVFQSWFLGPEAPPPGASGPAPAVPAPKPRVTEARPAPKRQAVPRQGPASGFYAPPQVGPPQEGAWSTPGYTGGGWTQRSQASPYPSRRPDTSQYPPERPEISQYPPRQPAAPPYPDYRWGAPAYQVPGASPWQPYTARPATPRPPARAKQQYNPWAPRPQRYPDSEPW